MQTLTQCPPLLQCCMLTDPTKYEINSNKISMLFGFQHYSIDDMRSMLVGHT